MNAEPLNLWDQQFPVRKLGLADFPFREWHDPPPLLENAQDGSLLVLIPGGKFLAGGNEYDEGEGLFEVALPAFYLSLHPVTNGQYGKFVEATKHREPWNRIWRKSATEAYPVTDVSWDDAQAYCQWAGLRLPAELEWEKAVRVARLRPPQSGWREAGLWRGNEEYQTASVWAHAVDNSPYGLIPMSGHGMEWCADWYEREVYERYKRGDLTAPKSGQYRVVRRGSWRYGNRGDYRAAYRNDGDGLPWPFARIGFRCACGVGAGEAEG